MKNKNGKMKKYRTPDGSIIKVIETKGPVTIGEIIESPIKEQIGLQNVFATEQELTEIKENE